MPKDDGVQFAGRIAEELEEEAHGVVRDMFLLFFFGFLLGEAPGLDDVAPEIGRQVHVLAAHVGFGIARALLHQRLDGTRAVGEGAFEREEDAAHEGDARRAARLQVPERIRCSCGLRLGVRLLAASRALAARRAHSSHSEPLSNIQ